MWKRIGKTAFAVVLLSATWWTGRFLVEPKAVIRRFDITSSKQLWPESEADQAQRLRQIETARTRLVAAIETFKQTADRLSPKLNDLLREPATLAEIDRLEKAIGRPLPAEYRAFLELHNGTSDYYFVFTFHSAEKVIALHEEHLRDLSWIDCGNHLDFRDRGDHSPRYLEIADTGVGWEIRLDLETGTTWVFQSGSGASQHCNSMTHVFEALDEWGVEVLKDGDLRAPGFGAAPL